MSSERPHHGVRRHHGYLRPLVGKEVVLVTYCGSIKKYDYLSAGSMAITEKWSPGQNATLQQIQVWKGWHFWVYFPHQITPVCFNPYQWVGPFWLDTLRENSLLQQHLQGNFLQATKMSHGIAQMSHILQSERSRLLNINLQGKRSSSSVSYCAACAQGKQWGKKHNIKDFLKIFYEIV